MKRKKKRERLGWGMSFGNLDYLARPTKKYPVDNWRYEATGGSIYEESPPCPKCGECRLEYGPDPCFGKLPGVTSACCGHGLKEPYVALDSGVVLRGDDALAWVERTFLGD